MASSKIWGIRTRLRLRSCNGAVTASPQSLPEESSDDRTTCDLPSAGAGRAPSAVSYFGDEAHPLTAKPANKTNAGKRTKTPPNSLGVMVLPSGITGHKLNRMLLSCNHFRLPVRDVKKQYTKTLLRACEKRGTPL